MSELSYIINSITNRWLNVSLSILLTALGVALVIIITQFGHHIHNRLTTDGKGIDIVVGAKGSPLQLVLSSVYHIDIPTGNMSFKNAQKWMNHPHVKTAIPLALGDDWKGNRVVGTTSLYIEHYGATFSEGQIWKRNYEAVVGSSVPLNIEEKFWGTHGITGHGHAHEEQAYSVVGKLAPTGTVLDRLILTSVDSVLDIHGQESLSTRNSLDHDHHHGHHHDTHASDTKKTAEITALLLKTKTPIANINLPRTINRQSALQAANPALEIARLSAILGIGIESFSALSILLIMIAAISVFSGLASGLENRSGDLAVLRALGHTKARVAKLIITEGIFITCAGIAFGLAIGALGYNIICDRIAPLQLSAASFTLYPSVFYIISSVFIAGIVASLLPAFRAANIDVVKQLSLRS